MARRLLLLTVCVPLLAGCYALRPSNGGGQTEFAPPRQVDANDIALPPSYRIEAIATKLTFLTAVVVDEADRVHVVAAGYSYRDFWAMPLLLRIESDGRTTVVATSKNGSWTGATFHGGAFYVSEGGTPRRILRITPQGQINVVVDNLPPLTDHHTNCPVVGPDGMLYFGQGTATNSGIVGEDNASKWLLVRPDYHDIPCRDITLTGENFTGPNPLRPGAQTTTGAYLPLGTSSTPGQVIRGAPPCRGAILRTRLDGGGLELVARGLRNPFGLAFAPDGRLFATENGFDERGSRPVFGGADYLWHIRPGIWYGWPDYAGGEPLTDRRYKSQGKQPKFLLAQHPGTPPKAAAYLGVHSSSNGLDFSRNAAFGYEGQAFIAQFGDMAIDTGKTLHPVGFKVVRVDVNSGVIGDFAVNRGKKNAPASYLKTGGLERPVDVRFNNAGTALYVADFGVMTMKGKQTGPQKETGVLWRITRDARRKEADIVPPLPDRVGHRGSVAQRLW